MYRMNMNAMSVSVPDVDPVGFRSHVLKNGHDDTSPRIVVGIALDIVVVMSFTIVFTP
jgi:hypothetical protein